jgi:hypothetical protein
VEAIAEYDRLQSLQEANIPDSKVYAISNGGWQSVVFNCLCNTMVRTELGSNQADGAKLLEVRM